VKGMAIGEGKEGNNGDIYSLIMGRRDIRI